MSADIENGTRKVVDGRDVIFYEGYWIRYYAPPDDTLTERKNLIESLTRRAFHHTEDGINTPGENLDAARKAWVAEGEPQRKRVNAAMLAGALFNRATDIFTTVVELGAKGVKLSRDNELMRECSECFKEALTLGKHVRHYSGEEGLDEVWGEPFKAFTLPMDAFYESRYLKVAGAMAAIDKVARAMCNTISGVPGFGSVCPLIERFAAAARRESEIMKADPEIFQVWPEFVASGEAVREYRAPVDGRLSAATRRRQRDAERLVSGGCDIIEYLAGARVPMPTTTANYLENCAAFRNHPGRRTDALDAHG